MKIVFATNNKHKLDEIRSILGSRFEILSLNDIGCYADIPETARILFSRIMYFILLKVQWTFVYTR